MESKLRAALNCTCRLLGADRIGDFKKEEFIATEPPLIRTQRMLHATCIVHLGADAKHRVVWGTVGSGAGK